MLRTIFIASQNDFSQVLAHRFAQKTDLVGVVWSTAVDWHQTWQGRIRFAKKRLKRFGAAKVLDEILFYLIYHAFLEKKNRANLERDVLSNYKQSHDIRWHGESIIHADVNSRIVIDFVRQRSPDIILAQCITQYIGEELRLASRHGVFLFHEGITPEYRGLYSSFWAAHNLDFANIGATLMRIDREYDNGEVFVQHFLSDLEHCLDHCYIGHKAVAHMLPMVDQFLIELERGNAKPADCAHRPERSYTYQGCSDLLRQRVRYWLWKRQQCATLKESPIHTSVGKPSDGKLGSRSSGD